MAGGDSELDALEKLLADVRRTIRDNEQFVRHLKTESVESGTTEEDEEEQNNNTEPDDGEYEEL
jgi:hypothetical protein